MYENATGHDVGVQRITWESLLKVVSKPFSASRRSPGILCEAQRSAAFSCLTLAGELPKFADFLIPDLGPPAKSFFEPPEESPEIIQYENAVRHDCELQRITPDLPCPQPGHRVSRFRFGKIAVWELVTDTEIRGWGRVQRSAILPETFTEKKCTDAKNNKMKRARNKQNYEERK